MKKVLFGLVVALFLSGCGVVKYWDNGKAIGRELLSDKTKGKIRPIINKTETVYDIIKKKNAE